MKQKNLFHKTKSIMDRRLECGYDVIEMLNMNPSLPEKINNLISLAISDLKVEFFGHFVTKIPPSDSRLIRFKISLNHLDRFDYLEKLQKIGLVGCSNYYRLLKWSVDISDREFLFDLHIGYHRTMK